MSETEFSALLRGPLHHPFPPFIITRLVIALKAVVDATGEAGAEALRAHCRERQEADEQQEIDDEAGP